MPLGLGLGLIGFGSGAAAPAAPSYEAESTALFARFSSDPGSTRKNAINACITSLKSAGVWSKLDALWVLAAHEAASARLNWVSTSHDLSETGTPTFTTDRGYTKQLTTASNLSTFTNYQQNSGHVSVWVNTNVSDGYEAIFCTSSVAIYPYYSGVHYIRVNDVTGQNSSVATAAGFTLGNRSSSTGREAYRNGVSLMGYSSEPSSAVPASPVLVGNQQSAPTPDQLSVASVGGSLNSTEVTAFYNALNTLKTAIGW